MRFAQQTTIDGERTVMAGVTTLGLPNAAPFSNAVIITEISPQNGNDAFIELQNVANEEIQIDSSFRLDGSYQFTFPSQIILQPGDLLIVRILGDGRSRDNAFSGDLARDDLTVALAARRAEFFRVLLYTPLHTSREVH